jgi:hypothetical protein
MLLHYRREALLGQVAAQNGCSIESIILTRVRYIHLMPVSIVSDSVILTRARYIQLMPVFIASVSLLWFFPEKIKFSSLILGVKL